MNFDCQVLQILPQAGDADKSGPEPELQPSSLGSVRQKARTLAGSLRIETAKFSRPCPKGRGRYYLHREWDAGSIPTSTAAAK